MIADLREILAIADAGNFAVPAFNVSNMETVVGVMQAAQETRAPVIFQMYTRLFDHPEAPFVARAVYEAMSELKTPAAFHLDHGAGPAQVQRALRLGATGVMLDASVWPLEENISRTAAAVAVCHACGVPVEGELGHVGGARDEKMSDFTDAAEAEEFVRRTGVAALAVMVGTAHGKYLKAPALDIRRIREIRARTGVPIVLHGGSGVPDDQLRMAIDAGVRKVNFATDLNCAFLSGVREMGEEILPVDRYMKLPTQRVREFAVDRIIRLGAGHR